MVWPHLSSSDYGGREPKRRRLSGPNQNREDGCSLPYCKNGFAGGDPSERSEVDFPENAELKRALV